jgi:NADH-quinone oxidoreductase subunit J
MSIQQITFYFLAGFILVMALMAVTTRHIFRAAIWLLGALVAIGGLYFLLDANFVAAVQIVVYVGGIVVLIIFSIFLTQQKEQIMPGAARSRILYSLLASVCGAALTILLLKKVDFPAAAAHPKWTVARTGELLLSTGENGYALPFELISILLLAAMIGCIVLALKPSNKKI